MSKTSTEKTDDAEESVRSQVEDLYEHSKTQKRQKIQFALVIAISSMVGMGTIGFSLLDRAKDPFSSLELSSLFRSVPIATPDFEKTKAELLESLKQTMDKSGERYYGGADTAVLSSEVAQLNSRVQLIERSISDNPERALSIPLLRRDLDELTRKVEEYRVSAKVDSDRLWSQQNTILQGIGALLLAVAVAAVTILYRAVKPGESGQR